MSVEGVKTLGRIYVVDVQQHDEFYLVDQYLGYFWVSPTSLRAKHQAVTPTSPQSSSLPPHVQPSQNQHYR